jgi:hypothetical protein
MSDVLGTNLPHLKQMTPCMAKMDRLGWVAGFSFTAYGVRIGVRVNDAQMLDRVAEHMPPEWKRSDALVVDRLYSLRTGRASTRPNVRTFHLLYSNLYRAARTMDLDEVYETFESDLQLYLAEMAHRRVFVHAGVVGWGGQAIVIPGRSHSGKTTLVKTLVEAGATYYSDEYAVLDADGRVRPYAKSLSIRQQDGQKPKRCTAAELGARTGTKPLPVGLVVMSEYKPEAKWRPRTLSAGQGALALLANTVAARRQPETTFATLRQVVAGAPVIQSARGEAREIVDSLLQRVSKK